ncbi:MAG: hypothetical protein H0V07_08395 [Propionibacteriales bacterium]|nr:hypothetical protein [Propionibacteriales bacterium]
MGVTFAGVLVACVTTGAAVVAVAVLVTVIVTGAGVAAGAATLEVGVVLSSEPEFPIPKPTTRAARAITHRFFHQGSGFSRAGLVAPDVGGAPGGGGGTVDSSAFTRFPGLTSKTLDLKGAPYLLNLGIAPTSSGVC